MPSAPTGERGASSHQLSSGLRNHLSSMNSAGRFVFFFLGWGGPVLVLETNHPAWCEFDNSLVASPSFFFFGTIPPPPPPNPPPPPSTPPTPNPQPPNAPNPPNPPNPPSPPPPSVSPPSFSPGETPPHPSCSPRAHFPGAPCWDLGTTSAKRSSGERPQLQVLSSSGASRPVGSRPPESTTPSVPPPKKKTAEGVTPCFLFFICWFVSVLFLLFFSFRGGPPRKIRGSAIGFPLREPVHLKYVFSV